MPRPMALAVAALSAALVFGAAADARKPKKVGRDPDLWATVNVCDTPRHPDTVGIRGSMPGNRRAGVMEMRFRLQYYSRAERRWHNASGVAASPWIRVGSSRRPVREAGYNFTLRPPSQGSSYVVRGKVLFRWRARNRTVAVASRITKQRRERVRRADPKGFSASLCELR